jgi:PTS system mannitol-specific IIC component
MEMVAVGSRAKLQKFGGVLSGMVMPNIGAFITWGLITAIFLETGWFPNETIATLIGPMLRFLLPLLIGYTGGKNVYGERGGVIGAAATMGVIVGAEIPMFMGAMIMGPTAAICLKQVDKLFDGKVKPGFEMIVNNFSAGILGIFLVLGAFFGIGPFVQGLNYILSAGVNAIIENGLIPFSSIFIEPAKVLFLNNAINHGILGPLGVVQASEVGKSILFILEPNPGPGVGVLLAYTFFGTGTAKNTAPGVAIIHAFGGIHEPYFPYILMKPIMILAAIAGAVAGNIVFTTFDIGLVATASPGSYFSVLAVAQRSDYLPIIAGMLLSTVVAFFVGAVILKMSKKKDEDALEGAIRLKDSMKSKGDIKTNNISSKIIRKVYVACDAGMGSSAMGASILRDKMKKAGLLDIEVKNVAIPNLPSDVDIVITHQSLTDRAVSVLPHAMHVSVDNFMSNDKYDQIVEKIKVNTEKNRTALLIKENIIINKSIKNYQEAIELISEIMVRDGYADARYKDGMFAREKEISTNLGNGVAIPHGTLASKKYIKSSGLVVLLNPNGIKWHDGTVKMVVGIASSEDEHLKILSNLALNLQDEKILETLIKEEDVDKIYGVLMTDVS